jgi:N-acetylglucosamine kinase-like BadF-type ATPase
MEKFYIGIDGGGTKTALLAGRGDGEAAASAQTSGSSWREHGVERVAAMLAKAVEGLGCGPIGGIAAGMPCYGESASGDAALSAALEGAFPGIPLYLTNDVEVGWAGAFSLRPGVHLVSGTGSIAYGEDGKGARARCGGWDEFFSDEGSAYWIARKGMGLFAKQSDGRAPAGPLLALIREELGLANDIEFIDVVHGRFAGTREKRASFQLLLEKAALLGDGAVRAIYADAAAELCLMAQTIRKLLCLPSEGWRTSYSGGVFKAGALVLDPLAAGIAAAGGALAKPQRSPVEGALLMAIDRFAPR